MDNLIKNLINDTGLDITQYTSDFKVQGLAGAIAKLQGDALRLTSVEPGDFKRYKQIASDVRVQMARVHVQLDQLHTAIDQGLLIQELQGEMK